MLPASVLLSRRRSLDSDSLIDELGEEVGIDDELSPFRVIRCSGFRRYGLVGRPSQFLEHRDVLTNADEHVAVGLQLRSVADWITVARNDNCRVGRGGQVVVGSPDHPVDVTAGRIVDEGIDAVPEGVAGVKDIRVRKGHRDVAVGVGWPIVLQRELGAIDIHGPFDREDIRWKRARR